MKTKGTKIYSTEGAEKMKRWKSDIEAWKYKYKGKWNSRKERHVYQEENHQQKKNIDTLQTINELLRRESREKARKCEINVME